MERKKWWQSKIIWANIISVVAIVLNSQYGIELDAETQAAMSTAVFATVNIVLRFFTNQSIR